MKNMLLWYNPWKDILYLIIVWLEPIWMTDRRIRWRTSLLPLWTGKWIHLQILSFLRITSNTRSSKSFGCGEVNLILILGSTFATSSRSTSKVKPPVLGLYTVLKPGTNDISESIGLLRIAITVDILSQKSHFFDTHFRQMSDFIDNGVDGSGPLFASRERNDTIRAHL